MVRRVRAGMRTRDQIRKDVEQLRSRRSYRTTIVAMRTTLLAISAFAVGWLLQYTTVPKPIVASILVASFVVGFCSGLVYFVIALFLAIERSIRGRSIYNPTANFEFTKVFFGDLLRPILRRRRGDGGGANSR